ncbi:MAG: OmpA family protein [Gallionellaceae bacterium]|nr:OmpA family protein [Gallionellaceae bacterium]
MNLRLITLATSAALLTLAGCASQQTGADPAEAANQRLSGIETRLQAEASSTQGMIDALGRKVGALSDDLRRMRETAAAQASGSAAAQQAAASALAARMDKAEQRLSELANATQATTAQVAAAQASRREQADAIEQRLQSMGALANYRNTNTDLEHQADTATLAERLDAAETQLDEMSDQISEALQQTSDAQAALTEKTGAASQRLDELAAQTRQALDQGAATQAALPALREKVAEADTRFKDYDARLAALSKRLDEVARMAQDAYDATGLGQRKIFGKVIESITLTEDKTLFPINSPTLGEQDKAKLDALALRLKTLGTNYHLQIQGHTEGFGSDDYNYELGKARAEVVKNYLKEQGGIPLLRMSVMSYGSLESAGYASKSNRRVVVQVLQ